MQAKRDAVLLELAAQARAVLEPRFRRTPTLLLFGSSANGLGGRDSDVSDSERKCTIVSVSVLLLVP